MQRGLRKFVRKNTWIREFVNPRDAVVFSLSNDTRSYGALEVAFNFVHSLEGVKLLTFTFTSLAFEK